MLTEMKKLSLVIATKNDLYNAKYTTPLFRLQSSLTRTLHNAGDTNLEIIIVDYGSDEKIEDNLRINDKRIKFIYIDKKVCAKYDTPFNEVKCINRGAKNATGNFVGRIDQDTIVTKKFFDWFNSDKISVNEFYFSGRLELEKGVYSEEGVSNAKHKTWGFSKKNWWKVAVGILLIPRETYFELRGYDESNIYFNWMEHEFILRLNKQIELVNLGKLLDFPFYHIYHTREDAKKRKNNFNIVDKKNLELIPNGEVWG